MIRYQATVVLCLRASHFLKVGSLKSRVIHARLGGFYLLLRERYYAEVIAVKYRILELVNAKRHKWYHTTAKTAVYEVIPEREIKQLTLPNELFRYLLGSVV